MLTYNLFILHYLTYLTLTVEVFNLQLILKFNYCTFLEIHFLLNCHLFEILKIYLFDALMSWSKCVIIFFIDIIVGVIIEASVFLYFNILKIILKGEIVLNRSVVVLCKFYLWYLLFRATIVFICCLILGVLFFIACISVLMIF